MKITHKIAVGIMSFLSIAIIGTSINTLHAKVNLSDRPCKGDIEKFCNDVKPGHGDVHRCLHEHHDQLSNECRSTIKTMKEHRKERREACKEDREKFCKDVKPGQGRVMKCLKEHKAELSSECQKVWNEKH